MRTLISTLPAVLFLAACAHGPVLTPVQQADAEPWAQGPGTPLDLPGTLVVVNKAEASASLVDCASGRELVRVLTGVGPHEVAVTPDGRTAVVANYGAEEPGNTLTVIDLERGQVSRTVSLGEYQRPHGIRFVPGGRRLAITAEVQGAVLLIDVDKGAMDAVIPTGQEGSHMLVVSPDGARIYVAGTGSGTMAAIDVAAKQVIKVVPTGDGAEGIDVSPDGAEVWVANRGADTLSIIDTQALAVVGTLPCGEAPIRLAFTPDGAQVLVSNFASGDVAVFDARTRLEGKRIRISKEVLEQAQFRYPNDPALKGAAPEGLLVAPQGRLAFAACTGADAVAVLDLEKHRDTGLLPCGVGPDGLAWSPQVVGEAAVAQARP